MRNVVRAVTVLAATSVISTMALAQDPAPRNVEDLIGERASNGERALENRGYHHIKTEKGDDRIWSNWWNGATDTCLSVVTMDGRYDSIVTAPAFDCDHEKADGGHNQNWMTDLIGARGSSAESVMLDRGFRDVDHFQGTNEVATWWYKPKNGHCLRVRIVDGRVADIIPAPGYPACK